MILMKKKMVLTLLLMIVFIFSFKMAKADTFYSIEYFYNGGKNLRIKLWSDDNSKVYIKGFIREKDNQIKVFYSKKKMADTEQDNIEIPQSMFIIPIRVILESLDGEIVFKDIKSSPFELFIRHLHDMGKIKGYPDETFKPKNKITREEFVSMLVNVLDIKKKKYTKYSFGDIKDSWAKDEIQLLYEMGIVNGFKDKTGKLNFNPKGNLTYEQAIVMTAKAFRLNPLQGVKSENASSWAWGYIKPMINNRILKQNDVDKQNLTSNATREWIAYLLSCSLVH